MWSAARGSQSWRRPWLIVQTPHYLFGITPIGSIKQLQHALPGGLRPSGDWRRGSRLIGRPCERFYLSNAANEKRPVQGRFPYFFHTYWWRQLKPAEAAI